MLSLACSLRGGDVKREREGTVPVAETDMEEWKSRRERIERLGGGGERMDR